MNNDVFLMDILVDDLKDIWVPVAGLIALVSGGGWTMFVYFDKRRIEKERAEAKSNAGEAGKESIEVSSNASSSRISQVMRVDRRGKMLVALTLPLCVFLGGIVLLASLISGDNCSIGTITAEKSAVACNIDNQNIIIGSD